LSPGAVQPSAGGSLGGVVCRRAGLVRLVEDRRQRAADLSQLPLSLGVIPAELLKADAVLDATGVDDEVRCVQVPRSANLPATAGSVS